MNFKTFAVLALCVNVVTAVYEGDGNEDPDPTTQAGQEGNWQNENQMTVTGGQEGNGNWQNENQMTVTGGHNSTMMYTTTPYVHHDGHWCPQVIQNYLHDAKIVSVFDNCKDEGRWELHAHPRHDERGMIWGGWFGYCYDRHNIDFWMTQYPPDLYTKPCTRDDECHHIECHNHTRAICHHDTCHPPANAICQIREEHIQVNPEKLMHNCPDLKWKQDDHHGEHHEPDPNAPCMDIRHAWGMHGCAPLEGHDSKCHDKVMTGVLRHCGKEEDCEVMAKVGHYGNCTAYCRKHGLVCHHSKMVWDEEHCPKEEDPNHDCDHPSESGNAMCHCEDHGVWPMEDPRERRTELARQCMAILKKYSACVNKEYCPKDKDCGQMRPDKEFYDRVSKYADMKPPKCISIPTDTAHRLNAVNCPFSLMKEH